MRELHRRLLQRQVLHADETTLQVLKLEGRTARSKCYMWLYRTGGDAEHPIVLYEYQQNRKAENAEAFLKGFTGWLHADGYSGYHRLPENIRVVGCWAHLRRKFDEAVNALPKEQQVGCTALEGLQYCNVLFAIEKELADLPPEERYKQRLIRSKPVMDALLAWAETKNRPAQVLFGKGAVLSAGAVAISKMLFGGRAAGNKQQPGRTEYETLCDGAEELAVCKYGRRGPEQRHCLQSD